MATSTRKIPFFTIAATIITMIQLFIVGKVKDFFKYLAAKLRNTKERIITEYHQPSFFTRNVFNRGLDTYFNVVCSAPGAKVKIQERSISPTGEIIYHYDEKGNRKTKEILNFSSYNYLGFTDRIEYVEKNVLKILHQYGVGTCSPRAEYGTTLLHKEVEKRIAAYVGKEDAIVFGMGFATNSTGIPALVTKNSLVLSDMDNHSSIIMGLRHAGATVKIFKHNDPADCEMKLLEAMNDKFEKDEAFDKIIIVIEGIYSMEGGIAKLKEFIQVKKRCKAYLYVDEAHSIGGMGEHGRGICEYLGVDPKDVDILMGTFTKSVGAVGGYIAGDKSVIEYLRKKSPGNLYATSMPPACAAQIIAALDVMEGRDGSEFGKNKLKKLRENSKYFYENVKNMGFDVIGDDGSPVYCILLYNPCKMIMFARELLKRGVGVAIVGSPAVPINENRARFCISAAHSKEDIDYALTVIDEVGDLCEAKYKRNENSPPPRYKSTVSWFERMYLKWQLLIGTYLMSYGEAIFANLISLLLMCGMIFYFGFKLTSKFVNPIIIILVIVGYFILKNMFSKKKKEKKKDFDKNEVLKKIANWSPSPLTPYTDYVDDAPIVTGTTETHLQINNKKVLNLGSYNMLGLMSSSNIKKASEEVIKHFRVGSCGPRVFLGTLSEHVDLESRAAKFFGTEAATLYPFGYCTISTAIPAFTSRKDIFIVDEGVNFSIQTGFILRKAKPIYFKHNDVKDLERILESVRHKKQTKIVVVEGLYEKYGDIAPVAEIAKLKEKYDFWWFLDDSYGVGVLGKTGRGTLEHCGVPLSKVDVFSANLENAFATMGGLVCGDRLMCEFQRMAATGYLYSATSPGFTACAGRCAMDELDKNPQLLEQLKRNIQFVRKALHPLKLNAFEESPIIHISVESYERAKEISKSLLEKGIAVVAPKYSDEEHIHPPPSIRLVVNAKHSIEELGLAAKIIKEQILE